MFKYYINIITLILLFYKTNDIYAQQTLKIFTLKEVVVKSNTVSHQILGIDTLSSTNIENLSFSGVGAVIKTLPNVSAIKKGGYGLDPVIRGFKYSQINIVLNGSVKIEGGCPNRMDPTASHIDNSDIIKIELFKGTSSLKYGPSFGGTINIITWKPVFYNKYKTNIYGLAGIQSNGGGYKSKIKVTGANRFLTYSFSAGINNYNNYKDGNGNYIKSSLKTYDYSGNFGFLISKHHLIDAGIIVSRGRNVDFPSLSMDEREDNTNVYTLNYSYIPTTKKINKITVKTWLSKVNHIMDNKNRPFSDTVVSISAIDAIDGGIRGYGNFNLGNGIIETGFDFETIKKDGNRTKYFIKQPDIPVKTEALWNKANIVNTGIYARYIIPGKFINWIASVRIDNNIAGSDTLKSGINGPVYCIDSLNSSYLNFSANVGFSWHIFNNNTFSLILGRGVRSPDMTERFIMFLPVGYDRFDYIGNPQLKPEINYEINVKNRYINEKYGIIDATIFFSFVKNFIGSEYIPPSEQRPQTPGVLGVKRFINIHKTWLTGFEFSYNTPAFKRWQAVISASYTYGINPKAECYKLEFNNIVDTYTISNDPLPEIPPFELNVNLKYGFFENKLVPEINWRIVAAQKRISQSYMEEASYSFQLIDLKLKYRFNKYLTIYSGIDNVFDKYYFEHLNRNIIGSSIPLFESGRNFYVNIIVKF